MADYEKHRLEVLKLSEDFTDALDDGDSVSALDDVSVTRKGAAAWEDVSSEFGSPTGTLSGDAVDITIGAASAGEQARGTYRLRVEVSTTNGEQLVSTPSLQVTDTADPDAP